MGSGLVGGQADVAPHINEETVPQCLAGANCHLHSTCCDCKQKLASKTDSLPW